MSNSVLIALNAHEGGPGPLHLVGINSSFSRSNCITNQISDKFYMIKSTKKLARKALGSVFVVYRYDLYIFFEIIQSAYSKWANSVYLI